jgi:hypothetical protein
MSDTVPTPAPVPVAAAPAPATSTYKKLVVTLEGDASAVEKAALSFYHHNVTHLAFGLGGFVLGLILGHLL